jgi:hypothetical protein
MSCNKKLYGLRIVMINFKFNGNSLKVNHRTGKNKMSKKVKNVIEANEEIKDQNFMESLKSNEELRKVLFKAKNITNNLTSVVVPQMAKAIKTLMTEINSGKVEIADWNTMKFLRGHCYNLASYDRKKDLNQNFEVSITMAVRLAIMMYSKPQQFDITKDNEILVMDKVATPFIEQSKKGQKGGKKKVKNTSEELVEIVPSTINKIWSAEYPTTKRPNAKNTVNISKSLKEALSILENLQNICESKKPEKILEKISDEDAGVIGSFSLIDFNLIRDTFSKYEINLADEITEKSA